MQRHRAFVFLRLAVSSREANAKKWKEEVNGAIPRGSLRNLNGNGIKYVLYRNNLHMHM